MKEIENMIEAARALAHHHAMLSSPDTRWGRKEYEDMRNSITAAEATLKRAKVYEGLLNNDGDLIIVKGTFPLSGTCCNPNGCGNPAMVIVIPEDSNDRK